MYGRELDPTRTVAHHRPLMLGLGAIALADERFSHAVEDRHKHLARLRAAQLVGCEWCLDFGSWLAQRSGCPEQQLRELSHWRDSALFEPLERLVLEYAEAMTRTPVEVSDELFARLRAHFDERQIVELTMVIALENLYSRSNWALGIQGERTLSSERSQLKASRSNWALGIQGEGFSEGMYCVRPDPDPRAGSDERVAAA